MIFRRGYTMFKITTYEVNGTRRLKLEGKLKEAWVLELEQYWRKLDGKKQLVIDLTDVDFVDTPGKYLLALMYRRGARFVAVRPMMKQFVAKLVATSKQLACP
jgi:anti-anti-sigma regulatory factor